VLLTDIGRGFRLDQPAAESFARILAIRPGMLALINSAYRSYAEQLKFYTAWIVYRQVFALKPGTSVHNQGRALDIDSSPATADHAWMVARGREYGWIRTNPAEPWHFEYVAALDQHRGDRLAALTTIDTQEDAMRVVFVTNTQQYIGLGELTYHTYATTEQANIDNQLALGKGVSTFDQWPSAQVGQAIGLIEQRRAQLGKALASMTTGGTVTAPTVDEDAIAQKVADVIFARMKE